MMHDRKYDQSPVINRVTHPMGKLAEQSASGTGFDIDHHLSGRLLFDSRECDANS